MTTQTSSTPATTYTPPPEMLAIAERLLAEATPREIAQAEALYLAYGSVTGGRSAVTGAELPAFDSCRPLVKAGWLAAARALQLAGGAPMGEPKILAEYVVSVDTSEASARFDELRSKAEGVAAALATPGATLEHDLVDPFLAGIREISSATRDLAEATQFLDSCDEPEPVRALINEVAEALHSRVSALAPPTAAA